MNDFANTLLQLFLYILRIITPFFALLIIYQCFSSLRNHRRQEQPLITLGNLATRDLIPVIYWENSIGRGKTCDIRLGDNTVSRDHAVLYRREDAWLIADTNSKSGVMVNGTKIDKPTPVYIGDTVAVGSTVLVMQKADRARKARASWFFDGREQKTSASPVTLLFLTSLLHFILALQLCFAGESFSPDPFLPYALMTGAAWVFFLVSRLAFHRASFELETLAFLLSGVGIILIGGYDLGSTYMQIATMAMGMVLFSFMIWFLQEPDRVTKWRLWIAAAAVAVLGINLIIGTAVNGSKNWIIIGPISIQPSEFVKIALILVGTSTLARLQTTKNLTEFIGFSAVCVGALFLMSDFGTACIFFLTFLIIAFIRSGDVRTIIFIVAAACLGAFLILQFKPYIADRFAVGATPGNIERHRLPAGPGDELRRLRRPVRRRRGTRQLTICIRLNQRPDFRYAVRGNRPFIRHYHRGCHRRPGVLRPGHQRYQPFYPVFHRRLLGRRHVCLSILSQYFRRHRPAASHRRNPALCQHGRFQHDGVLGTFVLYQGGRRTHLPGRLT